MALSDVILAATLNNQAERYKEEKRYADAEPLYKRILAINEKAFGPDHPSVALALNDLAELYKAEGRYADAEPLYKWAVAIWKKAGGGDLRESAWSRSPLCRVGAGQSGRTLQGRGPLRRYRAALPAGPVDPGERARARSPRCRAIAEKPRRTVQRPRSRRRGGATLQARAGVNTGAEGEHPRLLDVFCAD